MQTTIEKDTEDGIYIEEGSDLVQFERDVNKALMILSESRDINNIEFKTGIQEIPTGITKNWYSIAIHHKPKAKNVIRNILNRLDKSEVQAKELKAALKKIKNSIKVESKKALKDKSEDKPAKTI